MTGLAQLTRHRLFWPIVALLALLLASALKSHSFLEITFRDGHLYGT